MKVDREEQDDARRERIARAAFELFARSGLDQTSAQDIARAAFVSRTNLYRYYPSKIHMLLAHFERTVIDTRDEAIRRLGAGSPPQAVWGQVTARMADLGVRYRHLVGAVGQAVLGARHDAPAESRPAGATSEPNTAIHDIRTAVTLVALVEPVLIAMRHQGHIRPDTNIQFLASLFVDACLLALLHGGHRNQREVLRDWQDRFTLIMHGALAPGLSVANIDGQISARLTLEQTEVAEASATPLSG
ncbi:TetR/AcrR family transcriptional regulator [Deinococcus aquatilis]|jgi:AcrR family transcriptional regulator|uniref:TetR/AcrR family transcriptional regulator n=1 Tax=Deinococcus aquatilis TaxID=519440 RepID=UPI00035C10F2|nr:TetR/AcrR family transcriptional regulator [Deinococcus aquatilis]